MKSLALKLTLAFLLVGLTGVALVAGLVRQRTQSEFDRLVLDQNQQILVERLESFYRINGSWQGVGSLLFQRLGEPQENNRQFETYPEVRRALFVVADQNGTVIYGSPQFTGRGLSARELKQGVQLLVDGQPVGYLMFAPAIDRWRPGTPEGDFLESFNHGIWLSVLIAAGAALLLGGLLALGLTRSLRELTGATQALAQGELGRQVPVRSQDELGQLAASFNQMSSALAHATELRRKMTADIAHDLRTPLSVLQGYTEALAENKLQPNAEMFQVMHTEASHLAHLVEDLRTLSLADAGELPLALQDIQPAELLSRLVNAHRVQAEARQVTLQTQVEADLPPLRLDVERMVQVFGNLLSNAFRYTPAGGTITLFAHRLGSGLALGVVDTGPGIAPDDLPYVFERSYRADKARGQESASSNGETGLGLAIARSLVEAQGGRITVESPPGQGARFTIQFPRTDPDAGG